MGKAEETKYRIFCDRCGKTTKEEDLKKETFDGEEKELCPKCHVVVKKTFTTTKKRSS
jgi:NAD-dependent SIR2 family protein deacetylase